MNTLVWFVSDKGVLRILNLGDDSIYYQIYRLDGTKILHGEGRWGWREHTLPSGIYLVSYQIGDMQITKKVVVK
jgi:hypothetical protein